MKFNLPEGKEDICILADKRIDIRYRMIVQPEESNIELEYKITDNIVKLVFSVIPDSGVSIRYTGQYTIDITVPDNSDIRLLCGKTIIRSSDKIYCFNVGNLYLDNVGTIDITIISSPMYMLNQISGSCDTLNIIDGGDVELNKAVGDTKYNKMRFLTDHEKAKKLITSLPSIEKNATYITTHMQKGELGTCCVCGTPNAVPVQVMVLGEEQQGKQWVKTDTVYVCIN